MSAAISGLAAQQPSVNQISQGSGNPYADLSSGQFVKIILTELQQQDPLKPNDTGAILEQLSSLRNIESQNQLEDGLSSLVSQNAVTSGSQLIGNYVKGLDADNNAVEGLVTSMKVENGKPVLKLQGGRTLDADRVTEVQDTGDLDSQTVQNLLSSVRLLNSGALIGKRVVGKNTDGEQVTGQVTAIRAQDSSLMAELDTGRTLPVNSISRFTSGG